jgi:DHA1 family bicyclomycin/chloramphenicol resistance-like MFS transporter
MTDGTPPGPQTQRRSWGLAALLAALAMLGPFAVDMYLPAFPAIGAELGASSLGLQQTLSVYLFAFAFMMLWHGALSDALGRRPIILGGLAIYALGTLGCAIAGNIQSLWLMRGVQGLSAGAGVVVGRAIIRDRYHGAEAQRMMSRITLLFGLAPALAPVLGGVVLNVLGWRYIFWMLLIWSVALLALCMRTLPETLPPSARQPLHPRALWKNYRTVLTQPRFALLSLIPAFNFCGFFIYIAAAPAFLVDLLQVSTLGFGWLFIPMIAGIMLGALLSGQLAGRLSPKHTIRAGFALLGIGATLNVVICALLPPWAGWNVFPIFVYTIGAALITPSMTLLLLDLFPSLRGMASSLQGFVQFMLGGLVAGTLAPLLAQSLISLALGMAAFTGASFTLWLVYQRLARPTLEDWKP